MTTFLNWVFAQAGKVYDWFGTAYYTLKNSAANAWNWAVDRAYDAYLNAIDWAYAQLITVKNALTGSIAWLQTTVYHIRDGLIEDITAFIDWVEWKFNTQIDYAKSLINQALQGVYSAIDNVSNTAQQLVNNAVMWILTQVNQSLIWLVNLREQLVNLVTVFNTARINALLGFLNDGLQTLATFFANPKVFIFDVLQEQVLGFLAYVLAWSLGATQTDLPTERPWRK